MRIRDAYKGYKDIYKKTDTIEDLFDNWMSFMEHHKDIKTMCIEGYNVEGFDYREIALTKVFTITHDNFTEMEKCYHRILNILETIEPKLNELFDIGETEIELILYHGLGNAAGIAEYVGDHFVIMLGLEKITELEWTSKEKLTDLIVHEYSHIAHQIIRKGSLAPFPNDKYKREIFHMYIEGFATYCEDLTNGRMKTKKEWYQACLELEPYLKYIFHHNLSREGERNIALFGDWDRINGLAETGYFMGYRVIKELLETYSLEEVMTLEYKTIENAVIKYVTTNAKHPIDEYDGDINFKYI